MLVKKETHFLFQIKYNVNFYVTCTESQKFRPNLNLLELA